MAQVLIGLKKEDYAHRFDSDAMDVVTAIPLLPKIINSFMNYAQVKWDIVDYCGSSFHVTHSSCEELYDLLEQASTTLDLQAVPPMYIQQNYNINAFTMGHQHDAYMMFNSGTMNKLSNQELLFVIGHEMGHIKSGHVLYQSVATYLTAMISAIPIVGALVARIGELTLRTAIGKWRRMAEFTADRAGLLACQNIDVAVSALMKMSGLPERFYDKVSLEGFKAQSNEFKTRHAGNIYDTLLKMNSTHPWTVLRVSELIDWHESGEYEKILNEHRGKRCTFCQEVVSLETNRCPTCGRDEWKTL